MPVTFLFQHLRHDAASLPGGGTAAFMRLGNHMEAERAAAYIGYRHTFVVSRHKQLAELVDVTASSPTEAVHEDAPLVEDERRASALAHVAPILSAARLRLAGP